MGTIGHAALYVGDGNIIHAIQKGVSESNLEKWQKNIINMHLTHMKENELTFPRGKCE